MKKFLIMYKAPIAVLDDWMKKAPEERKEVEEKMQADWKAWIEGHEASFVDMAAGVGKTKSVSTEGVVDTRNDIMLYATMNAESHEEIAKIFTNHPHLGIPEATIEISEINTFKGM